jgi:hypothetical protein
MDEEYSMHGNHERDMRKKNVEKSDWKGSLGMRTPKMGLEETNFEDVD